MLPSSSSRSLLVIQAACSDACFYFSNSEQLPIGNPFPIVPPFHSYQRHLPRTHRHQMTSSLMKTSPRPSPLLLTIQMTPTSPFPNYQNKCFRGRSEIDWNRSLQSQTGYWIEWANKQMTSIVKTTHKM